MKADLGPRSVAVDAILSAESLTSGYDSIPFLREIDLFVRPAEVVALLGANGAGKSTLIMSLAGHVKPMSGLVRMNGEVLTSSMDTRTRTSGLAVITQERSVFMTLSVAQNLKLGNATVSDALEIFPELEPHLRRKVGHLSGGQQQMLAVARAICGAPKVILADEVSLGLAPIIVDRLLEVLTRVAVDRGIAVIIVEQFVNKALHHSDRAYVLSRGKVAMQGDSKELLDRSEELTAHYL